MGTVFKNRGTSCVGVCKTGTTLIRVSTVMGTLYITQRKGNFCSVSGVTLRAWEGRLPAINQNGYGEWLV